MWGFRQLVSCGLRVWNGALSKAMSPKSPEDLKSLAANPGKVCKGLHRLAWRYIGLKVGIANPA